MTDKLRVSYHKEIFPRIWDGDKLKAGVRDKLMEIKDDFVKFCEQKVPIEDVRLVGSCVNYNWTETSDVDLHIKIDLRGYRDPKLAHAFFEAKNKLWKERFEGKVRILGALVELVVEDQFNKPETSACYSLSQNKWIKRPKYDPPEYNEDKAKAKSNFWKRKIVSKLRTGDSDALDDLNDDIKDERDDALAKGGEYDETNLAFKDLRKQHLIDKIKDERDRRRAKELTLEK